MADANRPDNLTDLFRTTAIGGALFLLPLVVVGVLIGQVAPIVQTVVVFLGGVLPSFLKTPWGIATLVILAIVVLILLCFIAGLLARRSLIQDLSKAFEKKLVLVFPRYAVIKEGMTDTVGGKQFEQRMKPVLVNFDDHSRVGFETERCEDENLVTVYLPGAPDAWAGTVALVKTDRVRPLELGFGDTVALSEQLGRGTSRIMSPANRETTSHDQEE